MKQQKFDSKKLRQLAQEFLEAVLEGQENAAEFADLVTSVVRQWQTCDGNATLFIGEDHIYLSVVKTPLGNYSLNPKPGDPGWVESLEVDWQIDPEQIPGLLAQLNLRQTAETVNSEGTPLRLWVKPKERREGVEPLVKRPMSPSPPRDEAGYCWLAARFLTKHLLMQVDEKEMEILVRSVASQWKEYQGHACIFLDRGQQLVLTLTNKPNEPVNCQTVKASLDDCLSKLGLRPEVFGQVVSAINRGHKIKYQDENGVAQILWHDPKERLIKKCPEHLKT